MLIEMNYEKDEWCDTDIESIHTGNRKDKEGNNNEIIYRVPQKK